MQKVEVAPKFEGRQIMMILVPQVAKIILHIAKY